MTWELARIGVTLAPDTHSGIPPSPDSAWMFPPGMMGLAGVPAVDLRPFLLVVFSAPVGGDDGTVQDQVRQPQLHGLVQRLAQCGRPRGEHLDGLGQIPVGGDLRDPAAALSLRISGRFRNRASVNTACSKQRTGWR